MANRFEKRREEFGAELRRLREDAGLNGKELAVRLGWNAPKVSKLENGKQTASTEDLDAWLTATNASEQKARSLRDDLAEIGREYVTWKQTVRGGHRARQEQAISIEAGARLIRAVDVGVVTGLLQTPEYARHVLLASANLHGGGQDITEAVRVRMRRQQVLFEPGKTVELLMTESALLHPIAPPEVMAGQIHRLVAAIGTPNVRIGILPARVRLPFPLVHGYWMVDQTVLIETLNAELRIDDPDEVATYSKLTDLLWSVAAEGDAARELLGQLRPLG